MASYYLGFVGDSIMALNTASGKPPDNAAADLSALTGDTVTALNYAAGGTTSASWASGTSQLNVALADMQANNVSECVWMLGANDVGGGVSAATYGTNTAGSMAACAAAGVTVYLCYPIYSSYDTGLPSNPLAVQYQAQIDAIVNGSTVRRGDTAAHGLTAASPATYLLLESGNYLHPNAAGSVMLGQKWAAAVAAYKLSRRRVRFVGGRFAR